MTDYHFYDSLELTLEYIPTQPASIWQSIPHYDCHQTVGWSLFSTSSRWEQWPAAN